MADSYWYPGVEDVLAIHEDIVSEYDDTSPGVQNEGDIEFALDYVEHGNFGTVPETLHAKAYHLTRLLVANHPFVDGNKRTALNTTAVFYFLNGYRFAYDDEIRTILRAFGTDAETGDEDAVTEYLRTNTAPIDLAGEISQWREELVRYGVGELTTDRSDPND
ncbi:type II toxin-antitoxin system death-on-curing family toxin [Halomicrobium katesii]|uniref:type II toxin-antitoxin system death-on-curing family toxin n=1 Tax=Halomicrobium katesii TaxID=437163 RepID=UPI0003758EF7|nr:type II toxin-antitoxin system death-on-curing family toxin [Halomicrobium katesii]